MEKALYVPCYRGELGWELINYVPHVNHIVSRNKFKEVHIVVRNGREALYPMGSHFYPISLSSAKSMANNGPAPPSNNIVKELRTRFYVESIGLPPPGMRFIKGRKFLKYEPSKIASEKWAHLPDNTVTLCVRDRPFGPHKNWKPAYWVKLCEYLLSCDLVPVITGLKKSLEFEVLDGCVDLRNMTTIEDLIAILHQSRFAVGQSTGPTHLASLCGVPHAVWGSLRIQERYLRTWNPHQTMVEYESCGKQFCCSDKDVLQLVDRMIKRIYGTR